MELSQVAKAQKKGKGPQATRQKAMVATGNDMDAAHALVAPKVAVHEPPVPPHVPPRRGLGTGGKVGIGAGVLAAGGAGAYLYRRRRVEKSLSSMQRDFQPMMMRST